MLERVWRKGNLPTRLVGMYIGAATMENSMVVPQKTKNRVAMWSRNPTPGICQGKSIVQKDTCTLCSWASLVAQIAKNPSAMQETWVRSLGWEDPLEEGKNTGYPLQDSGLENSMDRRACQVTVHGSHRVRHDWATFTTFIAALLTIAQTCKPPAHPLTDEWIKTMWDTQTHTHSHTHTREQFSATKRMK